MGKLEEFNKFWAIFETLGGETQFCIACVAITTTYFGGAMYIAAPDDMEASSSSSSGTDVVAPASIDNNIGFEVPETLPEDDKEIFIDFFDRLKQELVNDLPTLYEMPSEETEWVDNMVEYTVAGGKMNRGLALMSVHKTLINAMGRAVTNKERCQSAALGWCVEFLQAFFLVADDVMDDSVTRRGQPCWFRKPEVKLVAINDSFILESFVYKILKKYFGDEPYYMQLVDLMMETTRQTEFGQLLDLTSQPQNAPIDLNRFTIERYVAITKYKTSFYSFYMPVAMGMIMAGVTDAALYLKAREILTTMGVYFQVQDDYLDCYGNYDVIGKIGTDIQDNKCSWLVVQALGRATPEQRKVLEDNYGKTAVTKINRIKKLYEQMGLEKLYMQYEEDTVKDLKEMIDDVEGMPKEVFEFLLNKIYKRSK